MLTLKATICSVISFAVIASPGTLFHFYSVFIEYFPYTIIILLCVREITERISAILFVVIHTIIVVLQLYTFLIIFAAIFKLLGHALTHCFLLLDLLLHLHSCFSFKLVHWWHIWISMTLKIQYKIKITK